MVNGLLVHLGLGGFGCDEIPPLSAGMILVLDGDLALWGYQQNLKVR